MLLSDCVRVGANEGEGGERLRSRLLPSLGVFSSTNPIGAKLYFQDFFQKMGLGIRGIPSVCFSGINRPHRRFGYLRANEPSDRGLRAG